MNRPDRTRTVSVGNAVRMVGVLLVFLLTLAAIAGGVGTTGVEGLQDQSILAWIYYAGGLFVFGGLDLGAPTGGPAWGRAALWVAYFMAPAITTTCPT